MVQLYKAVLCLKLRACMCCLHPGLRRIAQYQHFYPEMGHSSLQTDNILDLTKQKLLFTVLFFQNGKSCEPRWWLFTFHLFTQRALLIFMLLPHHVHPLFEVWAPLYFSLCFHSNVCSPLLSCFQSLLISWEFLPADLFLQSSSALVSGFSSTSCFILLSFCPTFDILASSLHDYSEGWFKHLACVSDSPQLQSGLTEIKHRGTWMLLYPAAINEMIAPIL